MITRRKDELVCSPKWTKENSLRASFAAVLCFWLPCIIVIISYISVIRAVRHLHSVSPNKNSATEDEDNSKSNINDHIKTLRSFYVLVILYFICGAPYFLGKFSFFAYDDRIVSTDEKDHHSSLMVFFMLLMFIASAVNPFIYPLLEKEHRKAFSETLVTLSLEKKRIMTTTKMKFKLFTSLCNMSGKNST